MAYAIIIISVLSIIGTLIPKNESRHWIIRGQANFRSQYLAVNLVMFGLVVMCVPYLIPKIFLGILLGVCIFICLRTVAPYTALFPKSIKDAKKPHGNILHLFIHNVYQYNNEYEAEVKAILKEDPDVILLLEVDKAWKENTSKLRDVFPYIVEEIREDTYGMIMMSKIKPEEDSLNHLVSKKIPSVEMMMNIYGNKIRILGIHPQPPIPGEVLTSKPKDDEIMSAATYINSFSKDELKVLVGDFNDVAWSRVSKKFKQITGLKDVRIGRGFLSTFPSYSPIQIPLDHVFCSPKLKVINFKTLDPIGSDHNPVVVKFELPH